MRTELCQEKTLSQVKARDCLYDCDINGYEIHHGQTQLMQEAQPAFIRTEFDNKKVKERDGVYINHGQCWGTYIHGIFDNDRFRGSFLNDIRKQKGWKAITRKVTYDVDAELDKLGRLLRDNIDMKLLYEILNEGI